MIGQPKTSDIVQRTIDFFNQLSSTSYAVFDNNYKYLYDKYNDVYRYLPCNGDMAGLVLSTTLNQEALVSLLLDSTEDNFATLSSLLILH